MSRIGPKKLCATATLVATSPISVGGEGDGFEDNTIFVDGMGRPTIPGTSFGTIRTYFERLVRSGNALTTQEVEHIFGPELVDDEGNRKECLENGKRIPLQPEGSHVIIHDARARNFKFAILEDGVAIDPILGSAIPGLKYDRLAIPIGARFDFAIDIELSDTVTEEVARRFLRALRSAFIKGRIAVGRGKTSGSGRLTGERFDVRVLEFSSKDATLRTLLALCGTSEALGGFEIDEPPGAPHDVSAGYVDVSVDWAPSLPVMQSAPGRGGIELVPLVTPQGAGHVCFVLKGSGIKGGLRAVSEWFVRSATQRCAPDPDEQAAKAGPELRLVNALWGEPRREARRGANLGAGADGAEDESAAGSVTVHYCLSQSPIPRSSWEELAAAEHSFDKFNGEDFERRRVAVELGAFHKPRGDLRLAHTNHNAINRWTGGVSQGALFDRLVVAEGNWGPIRLELDLWFLHLQLSECERRAALALLLLTLRAMHEADGSIGFGATRGMGQVSIQGVELRGAQSASSKGDAWWPQLVSANGAGSESLALMFGATTQELESAWVEWVKANAAQGDEHA